jgi:DNA processing protein
MSALESFVGLSVLPSAWWPEVERALRGGQPPAEVLHDVVRAKGPHVPTYARNISISEVIRRGTTAGLLTMTRLDPDYPDLLKAIVDPPPLLWIRGARAVLAMPAVAVVGARTGSHYALTVAERLAHDLAVCGVTVVSGLARGVDSAAHRGALAAGGTTIAVLGSGADVVYPPEHADLARAVAASGALVSELLPGTSPRPRFFPQRNRIISGLARATVVVEAGDRSGSLVTARLALEQGRDVLAVPGSVLGGRNRGGHALIRDGAKIVETADDILEELGLGSAQRPALVARSDAGLDSRTDPVLNGLQSGDTCDFDALAERTGLPVPHLLQRLLELELRGIVRRAPGGRFLLS